MIGNQHWIRLDLSEAEDKINYLEDKVVENNNQSEQ